MRPGNSIVFFIAVLLAIVGSGPNVESQEHRRSLGDQMFDLMLPRLLRSPGPFPLLNSADIRWELGLTAQQIDDIQGLRRFPADEIWERKDILEKIGVTDLRQIGELDQEDAEKLADRMVLVFTNFQEGLIMEMLVAKQQLRLKQIRLQALAAEQRKIPESDLKSVDPEIEIDCSELKELNDAMSKAEAEVRAEILGGNAFYLANPLLGIARIRRFKYVEAWKVVLGAEKTAILMGEPFGMVDRPLEVRESNRPDVNRRFGELFLERRRREKPIRTRSD